MTQIETLGSVHGLASMGFPSNLRTSGGPHLAIIEPRLLTNEPTEQCEYIWAFALNSTSNRYDTI